MKAIEYYSKYHDVLLDDNDTAGVAAMVGELIAETQSLLKQRRCRRPSAIVSVIKEHNQKFNAINNIFEQKDGASPLKHDGYIKFWCKKMPRLAPFLKG